MLRSGLLALVFFSVLAGAKTPASEQAAHAPLDTFVGQLTDKLVQNARYVDYKTPMVVATLVDSHALSKGTALGQAMAESFTSHLHQAGYTLVDLKSQGAVNITQDGDFIFSRDADKLRAKLPVDFVLAGTYETSPEGVNVNVRIIGIKSKLVVASAEGFLPAKALGADSELQRAVTSRDGYLERRAAPIQEMQ
ncbi:FlgO family outer membrane protein [Gallaecimonas pentaromativorans]|uniref:FlgO family outer membrane protein n=1 Tax=Gallaecimonas pentaromativorans TaxID=584787 RepID=UPI003A9033DE